ncbi:Uncharacterised protein [Halioglobus japonicus]|nr:Uncharacterised protein [Halioglobus japonicus]
MKNTPSPAQTDIAPKLLVAVSLLAGFLFLLFNWLFWAKYRIDIPVEDTVRLLPLVQSVVETGWSSVSFQEWIAPHASAHRIAVGRLFMALDYKYLYGDNTLFYLGSWLSTAVLCYLYFNISRLSKPQYAQIPLFILGMALIYLCSYTLTRNLISPINSLWYISTACSALSIYLFVVPKENMSLLRAAGACLLAIIAAYATFSGVIGCLVLALLAIQSRSRHSLWVCVLMLAFVVLYMRDVRTVAQLALDAINETGAPNPYGTHFDVLIDFRKRFFDFTIGFLSAPMSKSLTLLSYIYVIPSVCLILFGWVTLARQWFSGESHSVAAEKFYLAMATVFFGTALACSLGRMGFEDPSNPRYQTIVMLYWLSISGLLLYKMRDFQFSGAKAAGMLLVLLIPLGLLYNQSAFDLTSVVEKSSGAKNIELSTRVGIPLFKDPLYADSINAPQYTQFEQFLTKHSVMGEQLAPEKHSETPPASACKAMQIKMEPWRKTASGVSTIRLTIDGRQFQRYREVTMSGPKGGRGFLYQTHGALATVSDLLWGGAAWKGYYKGDPGVSAITLVFDSVLGPDFRCQLNIES